MKFRVKKKQRTKRAAADLLDMNRRRPQGQGRARAHIDMNPGQVEDGARQQGDLALGEGDALRRASEQAPGTETQGVCGERERRRKRERERSGQGTDLMTWWAPKKIEQNMPMPTCERANMPRVGWSDEIGGKSRQQISAWRLVSSNVPGELSPPSAQCTVAVKPDHHAVSFAV